MKKKALITGISGQDGSYLAEYLLSKHYEIHGIVRRESFDTITKKDSNLQNCLEDIKLHIGSVDNHLFVYKTINMIRPDEVYHLAASSFVYYDFEDESRMLNNNFYPTHFLLASIKELTPQCKFFFAGSSEMFGDAKESPQNLTTQFNPRSLYGISKVSGYYLVSNYRNLKGLFACTGILYNHESPRRDIKFVTRKVTSALAKIYLGLDNKLVMGNIDARRDWGYAPEYVEAMWKMLNQPEPKDYILATGKTHSVRELLEIAFSEVNLDYRDFIERDQTYYRPDNAFQLTGDIGVTKKELEWEPQKPFQEIIREMIHNDILSLRKQVESNMAEKLS